MGWVKEIKHSTEEIFNEVIKEIPEWRGIPDDSSSPYEYFSDHLRNYYEVTLHQSEEICKKLRDYYHIEEFYYNELKRK